jgi:hypothetical protein
MNAVIEKLYELATQSVRDGGLAGVVIVMSSLLVALALFLMYRLALNNRKGR